MNEYLNNTLHRYPGSRAEDIYKFLYQGVFGCEHILTSEEKLASYIELEVEKNISADADEVLSTDFARVSLKWIKAGMKPQTLARLMMLSSQNNKKTIVDFENVLAEAVNDMSGSSSQFDVESINAFFDRMKALEYPACHHSEVYRSLYNPSYRVISMEYLRILPLLSAIDSITKNKKAIIAIEGGSASGKTTLAASLERIYCCPVFHMDDFFLQLHQRTPERYAEPGGNVDRERFKSEVLEPFRIGKDVSYVRFDCKEQVFQKPKQIAAGPLAIVEGVYSMHPELMPCYDLSVWIDISPDEQRRRLIKRNGPYAQVFFDKWLPLEQAYFEKFKIKEKCLVHMNAL